MASKQLEHMNELYASIKERLSQPNLDLATTRDIVENLHLAATEPEAVTYAEVDADGEVAQGFEPECRAESPRQVAVLDCQGHAKKGGSRASGAPLVCIPGRSQRGSLIYRDEGIQIGAHLGALNSAEV